LCSTMSSPPQLLQSQAQTQAQAQAQAQNHNVYTYFQPTLTLPVQLFFHY
jgi:hypothetical protein